MPHSLHHHHHHHILFFFFKPFPTSTFLITTIPIFILKVTSNLYANHNPIFQLYTSLATILLFDNQSTSINTILLLSLI